MSDGFDHRAHLRSAWETIARGGLAMAMVEVPAFLRGMARAAGQPERYHETMTIGYLLLIADRSCASDRTFERFLERNPDLLDTGLLARFWRPETLGSDRARRQFVFPDHG